MLDRITGHLKIEASGKNELFGSLQTHCDIVTHLLTKLQPIIESNFIYIISLYVLNHTKSNKISMWRSNVEIVFHLQ